VIATGYVDSRDHHNLPVPRVRLIGREHDLAGVRQAVLGSEGHLVTLTGAGGCGKTSLAVQVARGLLDAFRDGVWLVELAPLTDAVLLDQAIAAVLGVREGSEQPLREGLLAFLRQRALLLLLDNCEHLVEACAHLAEALLAVCPELRILATSREPLRVPGEMTWRVPSLAVPDPLHLPSSDRLADVAAVQLFVERAQAARPDFALGSDNATSVAQVCARLEGLPLALELAAARTRVMAVGQIAARLEVSFRALGGGSRTAPSRQQTVAATLDWSHNLLTDVERMLFRRISVFAGGFDLEAAEAVCAQEDMERTQVLEVLTLLIDKSLVVLEEQAGEARYRLLEPIRQYAREALEACGEMEAFRRQHTIHFRTLSRQIEWELWGPEQALLLQRLERDRGNLRAALTWHDQRPEETENFRLFVVALSRFWLGRGEVSEGRTWLLRALKKPADAVTQGSATVFIWASSFAYHQSDLDEAIALGEHAIAACRELEDPVLLGSALMTLGTEITRPEDDLDRAIALAEEAVRTLLTAGERGRTALSVAMSILGSAFRMRGDLDRAAVVLQEALQTSRDVGNIWIVGAVLLDLAQIALGRRDNGRATALLVECLAAAQQISDSRRIAECLEGFGELAAASGRAERAARLLGAAQAVRDAHGSTLQPVNRPIHASSLAAARQALGDAAFSDAWDAGRAMQLEHALEEALAPVSLSSSARFDPFSRTRGASLLSARELEVAALIARGLTNPQIAELLVISRRTVDRHVSNVLDKLGFQTRAQIGAWVAEQSRPGADAG
jgi:non-specific serine/threonine protein kinase